jgi:hypothetical protein
MAVEGKQTGDEPGKYYASETCGPSSICGVAPLTTGKAANADCNAAFCFHSCIAGLHTCQSRTNSEL